MLREKIHKAIRTVQDFPKPGIAFKDITPLLLDPKLCAEMVQEMAQQAEIVRPDAIAGVESRGFLFGMLLAQHMGLPFVIIRKKGKLPGETVSHRYELEYGTAEIEMHVEAVRPGQRILIHDDLLATGGTAAATSELVQQQGGVVAGYSFLVDLTFLNGALALKKYNADIFKLIEY